MDDTWAEVQRHIPLARKIALSVADGVPSLDVEDLTSEAVIALHEAVERFDPERGVPFKSYAWLLVRGRVIDAVRDHVGPVKNRRGAQRYISVYSLEAMIEASPWFDVPMEEEGFEEADAVVDVRALFRRLSEREVEVLRLRFVEGRQLKDIGLLLGVTESRICQVLRAIAVKARRRVAEVA